MGRGQREKELLPVVAEPRAATDAPGREGRKKVAARTEGLEEPRAGLFCSKRSQEMGGEDEMVELSSELKRLMAVIYWAKPENRRTWKARQRMNFHLHLCFLFSISPTLCLAAFLCAVDSWFQGIALGKRWGLVPGRESLGELGCALTGIEERGEAGGETLGKISPQDFRWLLMVQGNV